VLYIIVSGVLTGILPYTKLNVPSPVSFSLIQIGLGWAGAIVAIGAIAGLTTVLLVMLYGQSRVFFAMSRDGLIPPMFCHVHPKFRTPFVSSAIIGVVVAIVAAIGKLDVVANLVNIGTLVAFTLVSVGVIVLRRRSPDLKRGFRVPFSPVLPILSAVGAVALIAIGLPLETIVAYVIWLVIGLCVYFGYSRRHSKLQR
jgi:APA family basic amino acid/polyamine antiporter